MPRISRRKTVIRGDDWLGDSWLMLDRRWGFGGVARPRRGRKLIEGAVRESSRAVTELPKLEKPITVPAGDGNDKRDDGEFYTGPIGGPVGRFFEKFGNYADKGGRKAAGYVEKVGGYVGALADRALGPLADRLIDWQRKREIAQWEKERNRENSSPCISAKSSSQSEQSGFILYLAVSAIFSIPFYFLRRGITREM